VETTTVERGNRAHRGIYQLMVEVRPGRRFPRSCGEPPQLLPLKRARKRNTSAETSTCLGGRLGTEVDGSGLKLIDHRKILYSISGKRAGKRAKIRLCKKNDGGKGTVTTTCGRSTDSTSARGHTETVGRMGRYAKGEVVQRRKRPLVVSNGPT